MLVGPGDDGAVLAVGGSVVVSTDVLVEGVHFRRDWSGPGEIGRKAVAVNVADVEAMGARPQGVVVGFSAPGDTEVRWTLDLATGLRSECATAGVSLLGGDTTRGPHVTLSVTALGTLDGREPVRRDGARPGDVLAVAGRLGLGGRGAARAHPRLPVTARRRSTSSACRTSRTARVRSPRGRARPRWSTSRTACWPTSATSRARPG